MTMADIGAVHVTKTLFGIKSFAQTVANLFCGKVGEMGMIMITTMDALPDYCYDCPCHNGENGECRADANRRYTSEYRPYWCPLKEVNNNA